jgi:hypothetical protein
MVAFERIRERATGAQRQIISPSVFGQELAW